LQQRNKKCRRNKAMLCIFYEFLEQARLQQTQHMQQRRPHQHWRGSATFTRRETPGDSPANRTLIGWAGSATALIKVIEALKQRDKAGQNGQT